MVILTPSILNTLENLFADVWISKGGAEVNVTCPYCSSRMGIPDRSGHLGLNFGKDAAHCVRCDWGTRGMRKWLGKMGFVGVFPNHRPISDVRKQLDQPTRRYYLNQIALPPQIKRMVSSSYAFNDVFAQSLRDKNISLEEARRNNVCYCDEGPYAGYVVFPFLEDGQIVYWQARAAYPRLLEDSKTKKRNPSKREASLGKSYWLYGYDFSFSGGTAVLTEGTLDQVTTQTWIEKTGKDADGWYALSLQGTAISAPDPERHPLNSQVGKLFALEPDSVIVMLDPEARFKAEALVEYLYGFGFKARYTQLPAGVDPNDASVEQLERVLNGADTDLWRNRVLSAPI